MKTVTIINRQPKHTLTMINFNWACVDCNYENSSSLSEEEDLAQTDIVIETCRQCRTNNRIAVVDLYNHS